ncbi:MAG: formate dehydrogenase accessory sulfurtransferase FdhD [Anaerolineae bacterium]|nr:formate dehydrogenase accessory sulfurtransferase FdhD [Caldilineales bacterium]MDW8270127.1 formate dehydrogenase accessory sulfurtransferase FdhD [Anaerolineae bacterium]
MNDGQKNALALPPGAVPVAYHLYDRGHWQTVSAAIVEEISLCLHVNGRELVTYQCSPVDQEAMAIGFLATEGFIESLDDIELIELSHSGTCVDVWLRRPVTFPQRLIKTSGCGEGVTFDDLTRQRPPLEHRTTVTPTQLVALFQELGRRETLYPLTRGIHAAALCRPDGIVLIAEDVGRHNTLDKLRGKAMLQGIPTAGAILITTGRISLEMLGKAAKMDVPIIASRTSPTSRSVALAAAWNITVVGYVRRDSLRVYTAAWRVRAEEAVWAEQRRGREDESWDGDDDDAIRIPAL